MRNIINNINQLFNAGNSPEDLTELTKNGIPAFTMFEVFPRFSDVLSGTTSNIEVNFDAMFSGTNQWNSTKSYESGVYVTTYNKEQPLSSKIYKSLQTINLSDNIDIANTEYWKDETSVYFEIKSDGKAYHKYINKISKCYTHAICIKSTFDPEHQNVIVNWGDDTPDDIPADISVALSNAIELNDAFEQAGLTAESDKHLSAVLGRYADGSFDVIYEKPKIQVKKSGTAGNPYGKNSCYTYYCYHDYMPAMIRNNIVKLTTNDSGEIIGEQNLADQPYKVLIYGTTFFSVGKSGGVSLKYYIEPKNYNIRTHTERSKKSRFYNILISRIFDPDLPFFPDTNTTLASLVNNAPNLLYINIPKYFDAFNNVVNTYEMFKGCKNLQYCNGFNNKMRFKSIRGMCRMFTDCENLLKCDIKLAKMVLDHNIDSVHDGNKGIFSGCSKLAVDLLSLLPLDGFSARYMNLTGTFTDCKSLDTTKNNANIIKQILWQDTTKIWKPRSGNSYSSTNWQNPVFKGCTQLNSIKLISNIHGKEFTFIPDGWKNTNSYVDPELIKINIPTLDDLTYTGEEQCVEEQYITVLDNNGYSIDIENSVMSATDADEYYITLKLNHGYMWNNNTTDDQTVTWRITKATNEWITEPSIDDGVLTEGIAKFGTVIMRLNGKEINKLPIDPIDPNKKYTLTFIVDENNNYTGLSKMLNFKILENGTIAPEVEITIEPEYGEVVTGLGENRDEVAVIFKNADFDTINWTVPCDLENVEFLVVGGGGGGGGGTSRSNGNRLSPGGGGGGGGVATGIIEHLDSGSIFNVKIGKGGKGGAAGSGGSGSGAAGAASDTSFGVNGTTYITAKAGGSGVGYDQRPGTGASVSGRRYEVSTADDKLKFGVISAEGAPLRNVYITPGGASGMSSASSGDTSKRAAGGGGGATEDGGAGSVSSGGKGGNGYESSITGDPIFYGSGGGGGGYNIQGGLAGSDDTGAGSTSNTKAGSATANRGGGGGGGGVKSTSSRGAGGNGGSGIVVLRFKI